MALKTRIKSKTARAVRLLMAAVLTLGLMPMMPTMAYAFDGTVTYVDSKEDSWLDPYGYTQNSCYMEVNGQFAMCCEHFRETPPQGTAVSNWGTVTNDNMRKIMFYGKNGPEDTGKYSLVQTACALSNAYGTSDSVVAAQPIVDDLTSRPSPPDSFVVTMWSTGGWTQNLCTWVYNPKGHIELWKKADANYRDQVVGESLSGAIYSLYDESGTWIEDLVTNDDGWARSSDIAPGNYRLKETASSFGFSVDTSDRWVTVTAGGTGHVESWQTPLTGAVAIKKASDNPSISGDNACYSLAGAVYGVYSEPGCVNEVARITTDETGYGKTDKTLWPGNYWAREITPPNGFWPSTEVFALPTLSIDNCLKGYVPQVDVTDTPINDPADILIGKYDKEIDEYYNSRNLPVGAASLAFAKFQIDYYDSFDVTAGNYAQHTPKRTWIMQTDERGFVSLALGDSTFDVHDKDGGISGTYPFKVSGDSFYYDEFGFITLPRGTLVIREVQAPEGYIASPDAWVQQVKAPGDITHVDTYNEPQIPNQVKRGDLEFTKADELTQERMAGIPFKITSATTGESHIVATDENGFFSSASSAVKHSANANKNDNVADNDGDGYPDYSADYGVWFGLDEHGALLPVQDSLGALPYDTYDIEELPCKANEGLQLVSATAIITKDNYTVQFGTIDDPEAVIGTFATDKADGDKYVAQDDVVTVIDRVDYSNLIPGREYVLNAQLVDASAKNKVVASATQKFTPTSSFGYVNVELTANTLDLADHKLVVYETLSCDGRVMAEHKDSNDANQIVTVQPPEIGTSAVDTVDSDRIVVADINASVTDTVSYSGLVPGKEYTVTGKLMVKGTEKPLTIDGVPATSSATFTPSKSTGTVDVTFAFDASALENGTELVAFESLSRNGVEVAVHADIADKGQTVKIKTPKIGTVARDGADGNKNAAADPEAVIVDTVSYSGLLADTEYTLEGVVMVKDTGKPLTIDGEPVSASAVFTPDDSHGTIDMAFSFDASALEDGTDLVVYETLLRGGKEITNHKDIDDEGQTVTIVRPEIGTTAADGIDGDQSVVADPEAIVVDTVAYTGLVPGKEYTLNAKLMVKVLDDGGKVSEKPLEIGGAPVTSTVSFTPDLPNGTVDVTLSFDASALVGETLVAFEQLTRLDKEIAVHADINDEGQTVVVTQPQLQTSAVDGLDGDKNVVADEKSVVVDAVSYDNAVPGKAYTVKGLLMDKETAAPLLMPDLSAVPEGAETVDVFNTVYTVSYRSTGDTADLAVGRYVMATDGSYLPLSGVSEDGAYELVHAPAPNWQMEGYEVVGTEAAEAPGTTGYYVEDGLLVPVPMTPVTAEAEFAPDHAHGTVELAYGLDASRLAGRSPVVFEELYRDGVLVASHADIDDEDQTVQVVPSEIRTTALDGLDGDKNVVADGKASIVDTVSYSDLVPGGDYKAAGIVMDKATGLPLLADADSEDVTGEELQTFLEEVAVASGFGFFTEGADGERAYVAYDGGAGASEPFRPKAPDPDALEALFADNAELASRMVMASQEFSPEYAEGTVDVTFNFDASNFIQAGKATDTVAFEILLKDGAIVASHADMDDEGQTTTIVPSEIATTATDKSDGDHIVQRSKDTVIVDTVAYKNLIPGKEYELEGVLMDKATGRKLTVDDKTVAASAKFTPNERDGEVELDFALDTTGLAGKELVAFESLSKDGVEVAVHADIDDAAQTVAVERETPPGSAFDKTGDMLRDRWQVLAIIALAACGSAAYGLRQRKLAAAGSAKDGERGDEDCE